MQYHKHPATQHRAETTMTAMIRDEKSSSSSSSSYHLTVGAIVGTVSVVGAGVVVGTENRK